MANHEELALRREELAFKKSQAAQKAKEDKAASGPAGIMSSVLSGVSSIGGMIPSLLSSRQDSELRRFQQGQGAGASLARQTASEAARRVVGASGGRGGQGALRAGLRTADDIVQRGSQQAAVTGAQEGLAATQALRQSELVRRGAIQKLGAGVGQGVAGISGMLAAAKDQGPVQPGVETDVLPGEQALLQGQGGVQAAGGVPAQGASAQLQATRALAGAPPGPPGSLPGEAPFPPDLQADPRLAQESYPGAENKGVQAQEMQQGGIGGQTQASREDVLAQQVANQKAALLQNLTSITADKMDAAVLAANTGEYGGPTKTFGSGPPPATDPGGLQEWIYNEVENFNPGPVIYQGMPVEEAIKLLTDLGYPIDYARLGYNVDPARLDKGPGNESPQATLGRKATSGAFAAGEKIRAMFSGGG